MARVTFASELVSECHYIPRLSEHKIPDYFYSREDIERFQRIWKSIILQRIKELKRKDGQEDKSATKRRLADKGEQPPTTKRRKVCSIDKQEIAGRKEIGTAHDNTQVVRTVSPVEEVVSR